MNLLAAVWVVAGSPAASRAQEPERPAADQAEQDCLSPAESAKAEAEIAGQPNDGRENSGEGLAPCEEPLGPEAEVADLADIVEQDAQIEASAEEVFEPGEEIPEDYPVPLPSDI